MSELIRRVKGIIGSNLGKDIGITLIAQLVIMVLLLVINKLLSTKLGVEGYGYYSIIKKSTSVISFIMLSGMGIALPRYLSTYLAKNEFKNAKSSVIASMLVTLLVSCFVIAVCIWQKDKMAPLVVGATNLPLYFSALFYALSITLSSFLFAYYRGANAFINFNLSQTAIQLIFVVSAIFFGKNLLLILNIWSLTTLLYVLIALFFEKGKNKLYKGNPLNWEGHLLPQLKLLFAYGIPRLVGDFFLFSFAAFPLIFISLKLGIKSSSFFATGLTLVAMATPLFSFLGMVLLPYVSSSIAQNKFKQAENLINKLTLLYLALSVIGIVCLWFGIDLFINLFFSQEFIPAANVSRILILTILFESIYLLLRNPIDAISTIPYNTFNLMISFVILIILFLHSATLEDFALSFLAATSIKAFISYFTWQYCRKRVRLSNPNN